MKDTAKHTSLLSFIWPALWGLSCLGCPMCWPFVAGIFMFFGIKLNLIYNVLIAASVLGLGLMFTEVRKYHVNYLPWMISCLTFVAVLFTDYYKYPTALKVVMVSSFLASNIWHRQEVKKAKRNLGLADCKH